MCITYKQNMEANQELAVAYAALILADAEIPVTADKLKVLLNASGCEVESYWPMLFVKALKGRDISKLIMTCGGGSGGKHDINEYIHTYVHKSYTSNLLLRGGVMLSLELVYIYIYTCIYICYCF